MRSDAGPSRRPQVLASAQMLYTPLTSTPSSVSISHDGQILAITREELNIYVCQRERVGVNETCLQ